MQETSIPHHLFLVDGSGFIFRAFHALPPMTRDDGTPVNAVFGYTKMLMKLLEDPDLSERCELLASSLFSLDRGIELYKQIYRSV